MAFRNKGRRSSWRNRAAKIPASKIPRSIARVRKQKIIVFNTMQACEFTCVAADPQQCIQEMTIAILRNVDLQESFGDNCKVASLRGSVWIDPWFPLPYTIAQSEYGETSQWLAYMNFMSRTVFQGRAGLIKTLSNSDDPTNPMPDYHIDNSFDWSEAPWIKQWNHMWFNKETIALDHRLEGGLLGICSDVFKPDSGSVTNVLAAGSGTINTQTGAIGTTCIPIFEVVDDGAPNLGKRSIPPMRPWRIPVNIRKPITMRENQNLEMKVSFANLFPGADCFPGEEDACEIDTPAQVCIFRVIPNIQLTIQYG